MYVILGSSIKNLILKEAFEKLKLPTKKDIAWFQKGIKVPINSRCLVKFTTGGDTEDEVWRDVVPMYTCHLSLKRSWLNDRHDPLHIYIKVVFGL